MTDRRKFDASQEWKRLSREGGCSHVFSADEDGVPLKCSVCVLATLQRAFDAGRQQGVEEAAQCVDTWSTRKGGLGELAWQIRALLDGAKDGGS